MNEREINNLDKLIRIDDIDKLKGREIGCGCNGKCYLTPDNRVFKELFFSRDDTNIRKLVGIYNSTFVFPETLVFDSGYRYNYLLGYIMRYVDGQTLKKLSLDRSIRDYINALKVVEEDVVKLSLYKIRIEDASSYNIIYTKDNRLQVIDTDFYETEKNSKCLYQINMASLTYGAIGEFVDLDDEFVFEDKRYQNMLLDVNNGLLEPSEFLNELLIMLNSLGIKSDTMREFSYGIKLVRRDSYE